MTKISWHHPCETKPEPAKTLHVVMLGFVGIQGQHPHTISRYLISSRAGIQDMSTSPHPSYAKERDVLYNRPTFFVCRERTLAGHYPYAQQKHGHALCVVPISPVQHVYLFTRCTSATNLRDKMPSPRPTLDGHRGSRFGLATGAPVTDECYEALPSDRV